MTREERERRLRLMQEQQRRSQQSDRPSGAMRPLALASQGIANFGDAIGGPANTAINRGLDAVGAPDGMRLSEQPFANLMDTAGVQRAQGENAWEQAIVGAGEAAGALLPAAGALRAIAAGSGVMANAARTLLQGLSTGAGTAAEVAAGAGARGVQSLAERADGGGAIMEGIAQTADAIGRPVNMALGFGDHRATENITDEQRAAAQRVFEEGSAVAGGLGVGGAVAGIPSAARAAGRGVMHTPVAGSALRFAGQAAAPFTPQGARVIAEDTFRGATADRFRAADNLAQENIGGLSPAQQTGDEGIMGIERARAAADPVFRAQLQDRTAASRAALESEVTAPAQGRTPRDLKQFFTERSDQHRQTLSNYMRAAERRLEHGMREAQPGRAREDASVWAANILDEAFDRAARQEKALWDRVPRDVEIGTTSARQALQDARTEATRISEDRIPAKARAFLGEGDDALGDSASMAELHRLYSEVRQAGREAMAQPVPNEFTARQSNRIAEAILADIEAAEAGRGARLLADARAYSREMNEMFGQGNVARILARTRAGDDRIPPEMALRSTVGQPREAGGVAVDDIRRAAGPEADAPMQDFLRDDFQTSATRPDGSPDPARIEAFSRSRREALQRFEDGVGGEVEAIRTAAREVTRRRDRVDTLVDALNDTQRGTVAGVVNAPKGREIARGIFEADNPSAAARTIARAAQRDGTGDAYLGLKAGLYDEVIRRSGADGAISGERMARILADNEMRRVLRAALPPGEYSRLQTIAAQMRKIERSLSARNVDTENLPNTLISTFVQIQAAKAGRSLGTGTIQVPGMFVSRTRALLSRVANDRADALIKAALEDPQIMSDLLIGPSAGAQRIRQAETRLTNWAIGTLAASEEE